jgi:hypothetical protein
MPYRIDEMAHSNLSQNLKLNTEEREAGSRRQILKRIQPRNCFSDGQKAIEKRHYSFEDSNKYPPPSRVP